MKCKISSWGCVYHACMSDDCCRKKVIKTNKTLGKGRCQIRPKPTITGYFGCSCHPFLSWEECDKMHKQKFTPGQKVKNRCTGRIGVINKKCDDDGPYWYEIKYGPIPKDLQIEHAAKLIKL